jgi:hypothetical protein
MLTNLSLIGGSDGPTSIFLAGKMNVGWMNVFGLIIIVLFLIPNIIYRVKVKNYQKLYANKFMKILEQISQYGCMFLMVFDFGMGELGFSSIEAFLVYAFGNIILLILYWILWMLYFIKEVYWKKITLAVIGTCLFLLSGITMMYTLLIIFGIIFGIGHIYIVSKNKPKLKG